MLTSPPATAAEDCSRGELEEGELYRGRRNLAPPPCGCGSEEEEEEEVGGEAATTGEMD